MNSDPTDDDLRRLWLSAKGELNHGRQVDTATILQTDLFKLIRKLLSGNNQQESTRFNVGENYNLGQKTWMHARRETQYQDMVVAEVQASRPVLEGESVVVYVSREGKPYARPSNEFLDGRFVPIEDESPKWHKALIDGMDKLIQENQNDLRS